MDFREATKTWYIYANELNTLPETTACPKDLWEALTVYLGWQLWDRWFSVAPPESHSEPHIFLPTHLPVATAFGT